jgi:hypothetical protein
LIELATRLPTEAVVTVASIVNTMLKNRHVGRAERLHDQGDLAREILDGLTLNRVLALLHTGRFHFIFHEEQLLTAARLAICFGRSDPDETWDKQTMSEFLLRVNDALTLGAEANDDDMGLMISLRRLGLAEHEQPRYLLGRYFDLLISRSRARQGQPSSVDLDAAFLAATGVTIEQFLAFGLLYCGPYMEIDDAASLLQSRFLSAAAAVEAGIADSSLLDLCRTLFSADRAWFLAHLNPSGLPADIALTSFLPFQERPLYRLRNASAVPLSFRFLLERATYGAYWVLHEYCRQRDPRAGVQRFKAHIGAAFQDYATDLLARCTQPAALYTENQIRQITGSAEALPDAVLVEDDAVIVLEMSAAAIPTQMQIMGDVPGFRTKTRLDSGRKFEQLDRSVSRLLGNDLRLPGLDGSKIRRIYPVLVLLFPFPQLPYTWDAVGRHSNSLGTSFYRGNLPGRVGQRQILTSEELEMAEPLLQRGITLSGMLADKLSDPIAADLSFKNWLFDRPGYNEPENEFMKELLWKVAQAVRDSTSGLLRVQNSTRGSRVLQRHDN